MIDLSQKNVLSSNCIGFLGNFLENEEIVIIDDVLSSGAAISEILNYLIDKMNVNICHIKIIVLAVDLDFFSMEFSDKESKYKLLETHAVSYLKNTECAQLSKNIATVLSVMGAPYDCDFPSYNKMVVTKNQYSNLISPVLWNGYDITNQYHNESNITAITLIPHDIIQNQISNTAGINLKEWVHLKVRVWVKKLENEKFELRAVPMALIKEVSLSDMEALYTYITKAYENELPDITAVNKIRFLQFYIAALTGVIFWRAGGLKNVPNISLDAFCFAFGNICGEVYYDIIQKSFENKEDNNIYWNKIETSTSISNYLIRHYPNEIVDTYKEFESNYINEALAKAIENWYKIREIPAKRHLSEAKLNFRYYNEQCEVYRRIDEGFPFEYFCKLLEQYNSSYNIEHLVSIFLDRAIDFGYVVPVIYIDNNIVCRAFRHGEGIDGIETDYKNIIRFIGMLKKWISKAESDFRAISSIALEKMIVLFCKFAKYNNQTECFLSFDNSTFLFNQFCLHGAVTVSADFPALHAKGDTYFKWYAESDSPAIWQTYRLQRDGYIQRNTDSGPFVINDFDLETNSSSSAWIDLYAKLMADWYHAYKKSRNNFRDEAIKLTSCESFSTIIKSLLAEIQYCIRNWEGDIKNNQEKSFDSLITYLKSIDSSLSYRGINSGIQKFEFYIQNKNGCYPQFDGRYVMEKAIKENGELIANVNSTSGILWNSLWDSYLSKYDTIDGRQKELLISAARLLYELRIVYVSLHSAAKDDFENIDLYNAYGQYRKFFNSIHYDDNDYEMFIKNIIEIYAEQSEKENKIKQLLNCLSKKIDDAKSLKVKIESHINNNDLLPSIYYSSAMIIDFYVDDDKEIFSALKKAILDTREHHHELLAVSSCLNDNNKNGDRKLFQRFYVFAEKKVGDYCDNLKMLINVVNKIENNLFSTLLENEFDIGCIFIPELPQKGYKYGFTDVITNNQIFELTVVNKFPKSFSEARCGYGLVSSKDNEKYQLYNSVINELLDFQKLYHGLTSQRTAMIDINIDEKELIMGISCIPTVTIGVITILPEETYAVKKQFGLKETNQYDLKYYIGSLVLNGKKYQIVLCQSIHKGNADAAVIATQMLKDWKLDYLVLLGVAGTIKKNEANIGDVVIANNIIDISYGSENKNGFKPKTVGMPIDAGVMLKLNDFMTNNIYEKFNGVDDKLFRVAMGPIGDAGRVIKFDEAESRKILSFVNDSAIAMETEAAGVGVAMYYSSIFKSNVQGPIIIRGISDGCDIKKSAINEFHKQASENASIVLRKLLAYL